jgi:hypothetical protein
MAPSAYKTGALLPEPTTFVIYGKHYLFYMKVADFLTLNSVSWPVPMAARSKAWVCSRSPPETVSSNHCCVLLGRGLCDELITRPEESYRAWCVVVCDLETSRMRNACPALGRSVTAQTNLCHKRNEPAFHTSNVGTCVQ